jgi:hypothetical protein
LEDGSTKVPSWLSLSAGRLSWTDAAEAGTYNLIVKCTKSGLTDGSLTINLIILGKPPVESTINIYGPTMPEGIAETAGSTEYSAITNTGNNITSSGST